MRLFYVQVESLAGKGKNLKNWKNRKIQKITYKNFYPFFPIPAGPYVKILPIVVLHSTAVEKTWKNLRLDFENGPSKSLVQSTIYSGLEYYI